MGKKKNNKSGESGWRNKITFVDNNGDGLDDRTGTTKEGFVPTKNEGQIRDDTRGDINTAIDYGDIVRKRLLDFGNVKDLTPAEQIRADQVKAGKVSEEKSAEMQGLLGTAKQRSDQAINLSGNENEALGSLREGMKGYDSKEVQAMREAANAESDRNTKTAQYQQSIRAGRAGVSGGAALAGSQDLDIANMQNKQNTERDLVIQNAQEQQSRRQAYADLVNQTEAARWGRTANMQGLYGNQLTQAEQAQQAAAQFNVGNDLAAQQSNQAANLQAGQFNVTTDQARQQFNNQQQMNMALSNANMGLQGAGIYTGQLNTNTANNMANQNANAQLGANERYYEFVNNQTARNLQAQKDIAKITKSPQTNVTYNYGAPATGGGGQTVGQGSSSGEAVKHSALLGGATTQGVASTGLAQRYGGVKAGVTAPPTGGGAGVQAVSGGSASSDDMSADKLNRSMGYTQVAKQRLSLPNSGGGNMRAY